MQIIILILLLLAVFGFVSSVDYDDGHAYQARYCAMVKAGRWPDYQGTYLSDCLQPTSAPR